jgi:outer membrane protein OmpA-like peptidoglycan-associated protein
MLRHTNGMKTYLIILLFVLTGSGPLAAQSLIQGMMQRTAVQEKQFFDPRNCGDCDKAIEISTTKLICPTNPVSGYGQKLEFNNNHRRSLYFLEKEHNSVWYKFTAVKSALLSFEINPADTLNDFDFVVYKSNGTNFCTDAVSKKLLPIRTNLSRNSNKMHGRTGLMRFAKDAFVPAGYGNPYSSAIAVKKGETYYLLIDNVTPNGKAHTIKFEYHDPFFELEGEVRDEKSGRPVQAEIMLEDIVSGKVIAATSSDSITGDFVIKKGYFFYDTTFWSHDITKFNGHLLMQRIPQLKKGESFKMENILFQGGTSMPADESVHLLNMLFKLMRKNKTLNIEIQGHTNGCPHGEDHSLELSKARAKSISDFLLNNGIEKARVTFVGYGCSRPVFPEEEAKKNEWKSKMNRRVEIKVTNY